MDPLVAGLVSFLFVIILVFGGLHVGTALLIISVGGLVVVRGWEVAFNSLRYVPYQIVADYNYAVFPLFILMGELAAASGVVTLLFNVAEAWLGRLKGGIAMAVTAMAAGLGAITGSAVAASAMMMRTAYIEMKKHKYQPALSAGIIAATGPLAILIPPSIGMAVYGVITQESIGRLLIAGLIPGIVSAIVYMGIIYVWAIRNPQKFPLSTRTFTWRQRARSTRDVVPIMLMVITVLGGLYGGLFTPSEAGAAGAFISVFFVIAALRKRSGPAMLNAIWETAGTVSMIFYILIGAMLYGRFMTLTGATQSIIRLISGMSVSPYVIMAAIVILLLFLGCFLDGFAIRAITLPILYPLIISLGFDGIWFGVVTTIMAETGLITPPFGLNVFAVKSFTGDEAELWPIFMATMPFLIGMLIVVVLITIWPQIALFLPQKMMGG